MTPTPAGRTRPPRVRIVLAALLVGTATPAAAAERSCGPDPIQNTADVLCAPPSGPCTETVVTVSANLVVPNGVPCAFDLGGRDFVVARTLAVTGDGSGLEGAITVANAGRIDVLRTGKLKARGDFVQPQGFILGGGSIRLEGAGPAVIDGLLDVTGDSAGEIHIVVSGNVTLGAGGHLRGNAMSSFLDEGERYADSGWVELDSLSGSVFVDGAITLNGQSLGAGGELELFAARDIVIAHKLSLTGNDGGCMRALSGDDLTITRAIDMHGTGDGSGGELDLDAGIDWAGDARFGGNILLDGVILDIRGGVRDGSAGFGGDLVILSGGDVTLDDVIIRGDADRRFDGDGGSIDITAVDFGGSPGNVTLDGLISLRGGNDGGFGGDFAIYAEGSVVQRAPIYTGSDDRGEIDIYALGSISLDNTVSVQGPGGGQGGGIYVTSHSTLSIAANLLAPSANDNVGEIHLAGCRLTVAPRVKVDASAVRRSSLTLTSVEPLELGRGARLLAATQPVEIYHPPGAAPEIGDDVIVDPGWIGTATTEDLPRCSPAGCGNGVRDSGEDCDDGNLRNDDGCSRLCRMECTLRPRHGCIAPAISGGAPLSMERHWYEPARARLSWEWREGFLDKDAFGDPLERDSFALCLYRLDSVPGGKGELAVSAGGFCDGRACWTETAAGFTYDGPGGTPSGVSTMRLETDADGNAAIAVTGEGANLRLLPLPIYRFPLLAQLHSSHGPCWEATYSSAQRDDGVHFQAVAD